MRKIKLFLVAGLLFLSFCSALFGEELLGFNGINFGSSRDYVKTIMTQKGWKIDTDDLGGSGKLNRVIFNNGNEDFYGQKIDHIEFYFGKDLLYSVNVAFEFITDVTKYAEIVKPYSEKYGFKKVKEGFSYYGEHYYENYLDSKENVLIISNDYFALYSEETSDKIYKLTFELE